MDLRERVWQAWQDGEGSQRELARRFQVSPSFVRDLSGRGGLDHLGAHKVKGVRAAIAGMGARLLYLPLCSPDLHPIELAWSKFQSSLRTAQAHPTETLGDAIAEGLERIRAQDTRGHFKPRDYCS